MLVSRDEQTCFVVSYKEVKACIDSAFGCVLTPSVARWMCADDVWFCRELSRRR